MKKVRITKDRFIENLEGNDLNLNLNKELLDLNCFTADKIYHNDVT